MSRCRRSPRRARPPCQRQPSVSTTSRCSRQRKSTRSGPSRTWHSGARDAVAVAEPYELVLELALGEPGAQDVRVEHPPHDRASATARVRLDRPLHRGEVEQPQHLGLVGRPLGRPSVMPVRQVDERARDRGHRDAVVDGDLARIEGARSGGGESPAAGAFRRRPGTVTSMSVRARAPQVPEGRGSGVAEDGARARTPAPRPSSGPGCEAGAAGRASTRRGARVQPPAAQPVRRSGRAARPRSSSCRRADHPVLPRRQRRDDLVERGVWRVCRACLQKAPNPRSSPPS